jgi:hypothetical protein
MELVRNGMDLIQEYWWVIVIVVALVLGFILLRPRQRVQLTDSAPVRPHMAQQKRPPEGRGIAGEAAADGRDPPRPGSPDARRRKGSGGRPMPPEGRRPQVRRRTASDRLHPLRANRQPHPDRDRADRRPARRLQRSPDARPDRRAGGLSRARRHRRLRAEVREALAATADAHETIGTGVSRHGL